MKKCTKCNSFKQIEDFSKSRHTLDSLQHKCKECNKKYRMDNRKRIAQYFKDYNIYNNDYLFEYRKEYRLKNKEIIKSKKKIYQKNKLSYDENFKIKRNLSGRLYKALKGNKKFKIKDLIGCSISDLKKYLESKFQENMSWTNYGFHGWHIDHIRPCASFDLTDPEQQKLCFHYTNLQPLWAKDNLVKSYKYE